MAHGSDRICTAEQPREPLLPARPRPAASATPGITIQGATYSHQSVARVLARLNALPTLTNVRLSASARVEPAVPEAEPASTTKKSRKKKKVQKPRAVVTFTITAGFRAGGPA